MRSIKAFFFILSIFVAGCIAQNDTAKFKFNKKKSFPVGTVLHYVKTNIDGTQPEMVSQFIAASDVMESFKFNPGETPAGLVVAEMDWTFFSAKKLTSWRVLSKDEKQLFGTISFDGARRRAEVSIPALKKESEFFTLKQLPAHLYNFDLASLNFAFPHLVEPKKSFAIGVADPTFQEQGAMVEYKGEVIISYVGDEKRNNAMTRKYSINGAGLKNRGGFIWVNKKRGWIEDMEIELPDNPEWTSFKFRLLRVETMSRAEWEKFMMMQIEKPL